MPYVPDTQWKAALDATLASRRADCGHDISRRDDALIWLRTERVGAVIEVWTVCAGCHIEGEDFEWQANTTWRPRRERIEYL